MSVIEPTHSLISLPYGQRTKGNCLQPSPIYRVQQLINESKGKNDSLGFLRTDLEFGLV